VSQDTSIGEDEPKTPEPKQNNDSTTDDTYERALIVAFENTSVTTKHLINGMNVNFGVAAKLLKKMEEDGYLAAVQNKRAGRKVIDNAKNKELVEKLRSKYGLAKEPQSSQQSSQPRAPAIELNTLTPKTPTTPVTKKRKLDQFEITHSQDVLTGSENLPCRMSTVVNPIAQKKRKIYRDPQSTVIGHPIAQTLE
jgi:ribosomal protein S25